MGITRVLQVFTMMDRGGAESMIMNYYRTIDRTKIQFDFLVHRPEKCDFDDEIVSLGGKIYTLPSINPLFPSEYYKALRLFFKEHQEYSIVHSHLNTFSFFVLKIAEEFGVKCRIAHAHIAIEKIQLKELIPTKNNIVETTKKLIKFQLKKRNKTHATHYFSCGEKAGKWLFGENIEFFKLNNSIDAKKFTPNPDVNKAYRKEFGLEGELVLGHVGRFDNQKNHLFLIKVFSNVVKKYSNATLILIGDGPLKKRIELEAKSLGIADKIRFLGVRSDVPKLLQVLDFFVFPSFYEGLPMTLIEAQAAGIKIFASDTITNAVSLTDDIRFLSINESADLWADEIVKIGSYAKKNNLSQIIDSGYDIVSSGAILQEFYLKQIH